MKPTKAQRRVLEAMSSGKWIHDAARIQGRASLWPPEPRMLSVTVPSPTLVALRKAGLIVVTDNGMEKGSRLPWYAVRYDITDAGRAAVAKEEDHA